MGVQQLFQLRFEDRRKVLIMGTVFLLAGISEMINYTSFMAIFNSRVGTRYLPLMYLTEAFLLPLEGWLLSYISQKIAKPKFMVSLYGVFIIIGLLNGVILLFCRFGYVDWIGYYVVLFLSSNFVIRQQTLLMWSTAFDLCPTQQAKRVMPIFVMAAIVGGILAGVISNTFASLLGPELLYILAALILLAGLPGFIRSIKRYLLPLTFQQEEREEEGISSLTYVKETLRSPFLLTVIGLMTLMPAIYFLIEYQYFTTAQEVFATEAELTSFYGLMVILLFCAALLLQMFAARLIDWLGSSNTVFAITIIFLLSLAFVSLFVGTEIALVAVSIGYALLYLLLYYFAEPSYQFFFKMLPLHQRDGFRYTAQSIAASVGILLGSGLALLHSSGAISMTWQAFAGTVCAAILVMLAWGARHLYIRELVRYLQVSSTVVRDFIGEFLESMNNDRLRRAMVQQLNHPNQHVQRFVLEMISNQPHAAFSAPLWEYAWKNDGELRAMALAAIHPDDWKQISPSEVEKLLTDSHDEVRAVAYRQLFHSWQAEVAATSEYVERARADESIRVRGEALSIMEPSDLLYDELRQLLQAGHEGALLACEIIRERKLKPLYMDVMMLLLTDMPVVRLAAIRAMGAIGDSDLVSSFMEMMVGDDKELQMAVEAALIELGDAAIPELIRFVSSPNDGIWKTTIAVLNAIGSEQDLQQVVVPSCMNKLQSLSASHHIVAKIESQGETEWAELARKRVDEMTQSILDTIWTVMVRFGDERSIPQLRAAVESDDEEIRDHGLEILSEGLGNAKLNMALLSFYSHKRIVSESSSEMDEHLEGEMTDPWLQALSIKAGVSEGDELLMSNWEYLSALDKIVFLRQVPFFQVLIVLLLRFIYVEVMKRRVFLLLKQLVVILPVVFLSMVGLSYFVYTSFTVEMKNETYDQLRILAANGKYLVDGERLSRIDSPLDYNGEDYAAIKGRISEVFSRAGDDRAGLYNTIYRYMNGQLYIIMDDDDSTTMFRPFPVDDENINVLTFGEIVLGEWEDSSGEWIYALGPILNSSGDIIGIYETGKDMIGFNKNRQLLLADIFKIFALIGIALLIVITLMTVYLLSSIRKLRRNVNLIASGEWNVKVDIHTRDEVEELGDRFNMMASSINQYIQDMTKLSNSYFRFVPEQFLKVLGKSNVTEIHLGEQQNRHMTILVCHMRGFNEMSLSLSSEQNFQFINSFLKTFGPVIRQYGGFTIRYLGPGMLTMFPTETSSALQAAVKLRQVLEQFNEKRAQDGLEPIDIGISIHSGEVMLGIIGEEQRMEGSVVSNHVQLALDLERMSAKLGVNILLTEDTLKEVRSRFTFRGPYRSLGRLRIDADQEPIALYDWYEGDPVHIRKLKEETKQQFESSVEAFQSGRFYDAREGFVSVVKKNRYDLAAKMYFFECDRLFQQGVAESQNPVLRIS